MDEDHCYHKAVGEHHHCGEKRGEREGEWSLLTALYLTVVNLIDLVITRLQ